VKAFAGLKILEVGFRSTVAIVGGRAYTFVTVDELVQKAQASARHHAGARPWGTTGQNWRCALPGELPEALTCGEVVEQHGGVPG
jgi:hypothetical protein